MTDPANLDLSGLEEPPAHSEGFSIRLSTALALIEAVRERDALKAALSDDGLGRGLAGLMMDGLWPEFGGNHRDAEFWHEAAEIVQFVIKTIRARAALRSPSPKEPTT